MTGMERAKQQKPGYIYHMPINHLGTKRSWHNTIKERE